MEEIDGTEWDKAWKSMPNRRLPKPDFIDWTSLTGYEVGKVIDVTFGEVPFKFQGLVHISTAMCAVCGRLTDDKSDRTVICLSPRFTEFPPVGFGACAHKACVDGCPEIEEPNPIPW